MGCANSSLVFDTPEEAARRKAARGTRKERRKKAREVRENILE